MQYLNFDKLSSEKDTRLIELKERVDLGKSVEQMLETEGWKIVHNLYREQIEVYKADLLLGCKDWTEYQEKRAKAHAMNLLLQDMEDFVEQGREANEEIKKLNRS